MPTHERINTSRICPMCRGAKFLGDRRCEMCHGAGQIAMIPGLDPHQDAPVVDTSEQPIVDRILSTVAPDATFLRRGTLAQAWAMYERTTLDPINAGQVQRQETRRAFYTGVACLLDMMTFSLEEGTEPTEKDMDYMDGIQRELEAFAEALKAGNA